MVAEYSVREGCLLAVLRRPLECLCSLGHGFVQLKSNKTAASAKAFLNALHKACTIKTNKLLTDNSKEVTDRLPAASAGPAATMRSTHCAGNWSSSTG